MNPYPNCPQTSLANFAFSFLAAAALIMPAQAAGPAKQANDKLLAEIEPRLKAVYETEEFRMRGFSATWLPLAAGLKALERLRPFVDLSRAGIWGWSGAGTFHINESFSQFEAAYT